MKRQKLGTFLNVALFLVLIPTWVGASSRPKVTESAFAPWTFRADWSEGFSGWMSYPLAQDVGYDPSLYIKKRSPRAVLIHEFLSHGESRPQFGLIRPLKFSAGPRTKVEIGYRLAVAGALSRFRLTLVGADGHHYTAALPSSNDEHAIQLSARDLGIKNLTPIQAIILVGRLQARKEGCISRLTLQQFVVHAERLAEVDLAFPRLVLSSQGEWVSQKVMRVGEPLRIELKTSDESTRISLFDGKGRSVKTPSGVIHGTQIAIPLDENASPGLWQAEVTQGVEIITFRFLVLGRVPVHPRLLLSEQRLGELRERAEYASLRRQIHDRARMLASSLTYNAAIGNDIDLMPSGPGIQLAFPGQLRPYFETANSYASAVAYNALEYRINGDQDAFAAARRALLTMSQWKTWAPPVFRTHGLKTYYEVGVITQLVAFGYDLIAEKLTLQERKEVAQVFWTQAIQPVVEEYFLFDRDPIAASNWMANSLGGAIAAAVADMGDWPGWDGREGAAMAQLACAFEQLLQGLFPGDGSEAEPTGYENFAMQGISWGMSGLAALGVQARGSQSVFEGFWWPYYNTVRPGISLDTGDFDGHLDSLSGFAWSAEHAGIPELRAYYDAATRLDLSRSARPGQNGHLLEEMPGPLDLACCSKPARPFSPPPPSRVFPERGSAVLRSGWDSVATVISLRVGPWFNHEHHDEGSFQVAAFGQRLIDEAGYANYYADPRYPDYFTQAAGHNTILVDGDPFSQAAFAGRYWAGFTHPHFVDQLLSDSFDYLDADLTSAYDGRLESYRREFVFLKPNILIVRDRVRAANAHTYSWILHAAPGSKLESNGPQARINDENALALLTAAGPNTMWEKTRTPIPAELFTDFDHKDIQPRQEFLLISPLTPSTQFLVGIKLASSHDSETSGLVPWTETAGEGLKSSDGESLGVVFRTGPGTLQIKSLRTDGSALAEQGLKGLSDWLAVGATRVEDNQQVVFLATTPTDVTMENRVEAGELRLHNTAPGKVEVFSSTRPESVEVDGQSVAFGYRNSMISLPILEPGAHRVRIR